MKIDIKFDRDKILRMAENKVKLMEQAVEETIQEVDGRQEIQQGYDQSNLRVISSYLYNSFKVEKARTYLKVFSNVVYSRIQDLGGWAGRNNSSYIPPTYYFTQGSKILKDKFYSKLRQKIKEKIDKK